MNSKHPEERKSIGCNHISRFVGFPNPRPLGLRIRVLHLSRTRHLIFFSFVFLVLPSPQQGGWGGGAQRAARQGKRDKYSHEIT